MRKIIIDCDPGHDDIIAILIALAHQDELDIIGYTTVAGNQTVEKVTNNLLKVLDYINVKAEVAIGADKPLRRPLDVQPLAHGESGMDGPILPEAKQKALQISAVEYLKEKLLSSDEKITLVALGPLTNIALLLRSYPEVINKIEMITIMGGSVYSGNILPKAEFNIYHDPDAAKIVFNSKVNIIMSGLEVCYSGQVSHDKLEVFKDKDGVSWLVYELMLFFSRYSKERNLTTSPIFDMTPIIHLLRPEWFKSEYYHVDIETEGELCRGMTVADFREPKDETKINTEVLLSVDNEKFVDFFIDSILKLDKTNR